LVAAYGCCVAATVTYPTRSSFVSPLQSTGAAGRGQPLANALIRAESRESLRETVLLCVTPLLAARCISGCAARNASPAARLSPLAIAASTFLTKVRMRDLRAWLRSVRRSVCRWRLRAEAVLAMGIRSFGFRVLPATSWRPAGGNACSMHRPPPGQARLRSPNQKTTVDCLQATKMATARAELMTLFIVDLYSIVPLGFAKRTKMAGWLAPAGSARWNEGKCGVPARSGHDTDHQPCWQCKPDTDCKPDSYGC
jgi:hypothetical protein